MGDRNWEIHEFLREFLPSPFVLQAWFPAMTQCDSGLEAPVR